MALYVKGDIHGNPSSFSSSAFPEGKTLTREDYVLILGDFGMVWNYKGETANESYWLDWLEDKPWTTLFIDGNHENFDRLDALPQADWHGGKVSYIRPHILHLKRGYVFDIDGCKCFCMGGASSHDIRDGILDIEKDAKLIKQWEKDYFKLFRINLTKSKYEIISILSTGIVMFEFLANTILPYHLPSISSVAYAATSNIYD